MILATGATIAGQESLGLLDLYCWQLEDSLGQNSLTIANTGRDGVLSFKSHTAKIAYYNKTSYQSGYKQSFMDLWVDLTVCAACF